MKNKSYKISANSNAQIIEENDSLIVGNNANFSFSKYIFWILGVLLVSLIFFVLKMYNLIPYSSDEYIYIAQGKLIAEGLTPYKDFSMAHPPVQALFIALMFKVFGYHFVLFRMLAAGWALLGGIVLAMIVKRELGAIASVFSMALYILAYEPLRASIHFTGVSMTIALLMFALLFHRRNNLLLCAVFCVLAVFTRLYALPAVFSLVLFTWWSSRKEALELARYGVFSGLILFVLFSVWTGFSAFMNDVFLFQASKTPMRAEQIAFMRDAVLFHNAVPLILFILGAITVTSKYFNAIKEATDAKKSKKAKIQNQEYNDIRFVLFSVITVLMILMILLNMSRVWMYYYVLAFPFAAIVGGWMIAQWWNFISNQIRKISSAGIHQQINPKWAMASLTVFVLFYFASPKLEHRLDYYKEFLQSGKNKETNYVWKDGILPSSINSTVKNIFWKDTRILGNRYNSFTYYLWHSCRELDITDELVEFVKANCTPEKRIFGDSGTVPLISLLSGRNIAGNRVDTNIEQFRSGNVDAKKLVREIDNASTQLIILRDKFGVAVLPEIQNMINRNYTEVKSLRSKTGFTLRVFERKGS